MTPTDKFRARATTNGGGIARVTYFRSKPKATRFSAFTPDELDVIFHGLNDFAGRPAHESLRDSLVDELEREPLRGGESS